MRLGGQKVAILRQALNFRQKILWVLNISYMPLNFDLNGSFSAPNISFLNENFRTENFSDNFPTAQFFGRGEGGESGGITPLRRHHYHKHPVSAALAACREVIRSNRCALASSPFPDATVCRIVGFD